MLSEILQILFTRKDVNEVFAEIGELEKAIFQTNTDAWEKALQTGVREQIAEIIRRESEVLENRKNYLGMLKSQIQNMTPVRLVVGTNLTESQIIKTGKWLKENLGSGILLDLDVNPDLIGGATVAYGGKYGDYSVKSYLDKYWAQESTRLPEGA